MSDEIYPAEPRPQFDLLASQDFDTSIVNFRGSAEQRRSNQMFPVYDYALVYDFLTSDQIDLFWNFYQRMKGAGESFWYYDHKSSLLNSNHYNQYIGYGDGLQTIFDLPGRLSVEATSPQYDWDFSDGVLPSEIEGISADVSLEVIGDRLVMTIQPDPVGPLIRIRNTPPSDPNDYRKIRYRYRYAGGDYAFTKNDYIRFTDVGEVTEGYSGHTGNNLDPFGQFTEVQIDLTLDKVSGADYLTLGNVERYEFRGFGSGTADYPGPDPVVFEFDYITVAQNFSRNLTVYQSGTALVENVDYRILYGNGAANSDRIEFIIAPPSLGSLLTCDFQGTLRSRNRFLNDSMDYEWFVNDLFRSGLELKGLPNPS